MSESADEKRPEEAREARRPGAVDQAKNGGTRALLLVDHGSVRDEANDLLEAVCAAIDARLRAEAGAPEFAFAEFCHMELAPPTIAEGLAACVRRGAREVVIMPYFLAPGRHSQSDIPRLAAAAAAGHPGLRVVIAPPLGLHDKLLEVALERAVEGLEALRHDGDGAPSA